MTNEPETTDAATASSSPDQPCADFPLSARVEALLLSTDRPLGEARMSALLGLPGKGTARQVLDAIDELNRAYDDTGRTFRIERLAGGWQLLTRPEFGDLLAVLHSDRQLARLSQAALETLAIIAYRQPIMRAEIEAIRGVACGEVLRGLLERRLIKITGRAEELGRPTLYGTTKDFLKTFGLSGLDDLPPLEGHDATDPRSRKGATPKNESPHARSDEGSDEDPEQAGERISPPGRQRDDRDDESQSSDIAVNPANRAEQP